jgi:hypothetical protein
MSIFPFLITSYIQTESTRPPIPRGNVAEAWSCPLTSIQYRGQELWSYTSTPPYVFMTQCLIIPEQGPNYLLITVATRTKACTVFAHSNTGIVGSNPTWGMDVSVRLFCACVVLCAGGGPLTGWSSVRGVLLTVYKIKKLRNCPRSNGL